VWRTPRTGQLALVVLAGTVAVLTALAVMQPAGRTWAAEIRTQQPTLQAASPTAGSTTHHLRQGRTLPADELSLSGDQT